MHEPIITVVGNVGAAPRTRVLASGAVVTDFRIASTPRRVDKASGAWSDGETIWFGVSCWRQLAENVAASLRTGDRVVVTGTLRAHTWRTEQGEDRSGLEVDAQTVGFDLSRGRAVQERSVPLTVTTDPGRRVDTRTGELLDGPSADTGARDAGRLDDGHLHAGALDDGGLDTGDLDTGDLDTRVFDLDDTGSAGSLTGPPGASRSAVA